MKRHTLSMTLLFYLDPGLLFPHFKMAFKLQVDKIQIADRQINI